MRYTRERRRYMATTWPGPLCEWTAVSTQGTAAQATVAYSTPAADTVPANPLTKKRSVVTQLVASIATGTTAQGPVNWALLDGTATMAGGVLAAPANQAANVPLSDLNIVCTSGTVTLQFAGAPVAGAQQVVSMGGYNLGYGGR